MKEAVTAKLRKQGLLSSASLCDAPPLKIDDDAAVVHCRQTSKSSETPPAKKPKLMTTFKEVWRVANAEKSLLETSMYEASGNATWVDCLPIGNDKLKMQMGTYRQLKECMSLFNSPNMARIVFPFTLETHISDPHAFKSRFPRDLPLVSGHIVMVAWWLCVLEALDSEKDDTNRLMLLWQCALSTTIRVQVVTDEQSLAMYSLRASENIRIVQKTTSDNLIGFADKVKIIQSQMGSNNGVQTLEALIAAKITYNSTKISKTMVAACVAISNLNVKARESLLFIESRYGRDILTSGYTKLYRLINTVTAKTPNSKHTESLIADVLALLALYLDINLNGTDFGPGDINEAFLTGKETTTKKHARNGDHFSQLPWVNAALTLLHLLRYAHNVVSNLDNKPDGLTTALQFFSSPSVYHNHLRTVMIDHSGDESNDGCQGGNASTKVLDLAKQKLSSHSKGPEETHLAHTRILAWFQNLLEFRFVQDIVSIADNEKLGDALHLNTNLAMCEEYVFALQALAVVNNDIPTTAPTAPPLSFRQLVRVSSDPYIEEDATVKKNKLLELREADSSNNMSLNLTN